MKELVVIGGGLAGSEAAWQAAQRGIRVRLFEMRPRLSTGAHTTDKFAELVCSNSLGSTQIDRASGVLKEEVRRLGSMLFECADQSSVPAGSALAVDRDAFAERVTARIESHPNIEIVREEVTAIPTGPAVIASGPLTSPAFSAALAALGGEEHLYFFDAIAPIVALESVDFSIAFRASRWDKGETDDGDYINCPLDRAEYETFVRELVAAERIELREFEAAMKAGVKAGAHHFFEGCLPVEILAERGAESLAFGPMRPVGLVDPRTGRRPHAVVQLRQDNLAGDCYNMVGFQTNLKFPEQQRVFRLIPGLANAEFVRLGQMHRNTFVNAPKLLLPTMQFRARPDLFFAGQLTGVEGYMGNIATGLLAGMNAARMLRDEPLLVLPPTTMLGALCHYVTHAAEADFQPMKANFGILPPLPPIESPPGTRRKKLNKAERSAAYSQRALADLDALLSSLPEFSQPPHA